MPPIRWARRYADRPRQKRTRPRTTPPAASQARITGRAPGGGDARPPRDAPAPSGPSERCEDEDDPQCDQEDRPHDPPVQLRGDLGEEEGTAEADEHEPTDDRPGPRVPRVLVGLARDRPPGRIPPRAPRGSGARRRRVPPGPRRRPSPPGSRRTRHPRQRRPGPRGPGRPPRPVRCPSRSRRSGSHPAGGTEDAGAGHAEEGGAGVPQGGGGAPAAPAARAAAS